MKTLAALGHYALAAWFGALILLTYPLGLLGFYGPILYASFRHDYHMEEADRLLGSEL